MQLHRIRILSGSCKGRKLLFQPHKAIRPTTDRFRETVFNILIHRFYPLDENQSSKDQLSGLKVMDLFAGIGSYGLEALSRGAQQAFFVDERFATLGQLKEFIKKLAFQDRATVYCKRLPEELPTQEKVDLVFIDPPYDFCQEALQVLLSEMRNVLSPNGLVMLEFPTLMKSPAGLELVLSRKVSKSRATFFRLN